MDGARSPSSGIPSTSNTFGRSRRITESGAFGRLLKSGRRRSYSGYQFFWAVRPGGQARLGLLVTKRHSRRAIDRNRLKRSLREAFRLELKDLLPIDVLIRPPFGARPGMQMMNTIRGVLRELR